MKDMTDGSELLTGPDAGSLLEAAISEAAGSLQSWVLDHVDHRPGRSTTALFRAQVAWPQVDGQGAAPREEIFGASSHRGPERRSPARPENSLVLSDGRSTVRVWRYPNDPWLPTLSDVTYAESLPRVLAAAGVPMAGSPDAPVRPEVVSYRPGRRAVLRADLPDRRVFIKVLRPGFAARIAERHEALLAAGVPAPRVAAATDEGLLVLETLPGEPLADAVLTHGAAAAPPAEMVAMLDRLPISLRSADRRAPWAESAEYYAGIVRAALPALRSRLDALVGAVERGLATRDDSLLGMPDIVHGDFYEAQVFVESGRIVGLLDIDNVGPGRRADDLACLLAHLSILADYGTYGRISAELTQRLDQTVRDYLTAFDRRVDPVELRLRTAGVVLSLATGPHRQQEDGWETATTQMLGVSERWVAAAGV